MFRVLLYSLSCDGFARKLTSQNQGCRWCSKNNFIDIKGILTFSKFKFFDKKLRFFSQNHHISSRQPWSFFVTAAEHKQKLSAAKLSACARELSKRSVIDYLLDFNNMWIIDILGSTSDPGCDAICFNVCSKQLMFLEK